MFKHMRIFAVVLLAVMPFAGFTESSSLSGSSSQKSYRKSSGRKHKSKKKSRKLDSSKLAEGKKAIEEDKKLGIVFENSKDGIVLKGFPQHSNIKSYKIPYGVTKIGNRAFYACENPTSVTIPNSVTEIGHEAFRHCNLTSVTIPNSVTKIGDRAFWGRKITSINIPDSIESMPYDAFDNTKEVIAAQKNPNFYFDNRGVLFNKKTKALLGAPSNLTGNYVIPDSVTKIGDCAFWCCRKLTSITIPDSVNKIGDFAFAKCVRLTSITLPSRFKGQERRLRIPDRCRIIYR